jgi:hypothetical protein
MLIGVVGFARAGKDSVGQILVERAGFTRIAFADKMKEFALAVDPYIPIEVMPANSGPILLGEKVAPITHFRRLSKVVADLGWEKAKTNPEVRRVLQKIGTEGGRLTVGPNMWVDAVDLPHVPDRTVITDVRFLNEASAIQALGGVIWRVVRPGIEPANNHPSEMEQRSIREDDLIENDGSLEDLADTVMLALERLHGSALRLV